MFREEEYHRLRLCLQIDSPNIDQELERAPTFLLEAIEQRAYAQYQHETKAQELAITKAVKAAELGDEMVGGKPRSATSVQLELPSVPEVVVAQEAVMEALRDLNAWNGLVDAMRQKGHSLKSIADLTIAGYTAKRSVYQRDGGAADYQRDRDEMAAGRAARRKQIPA